MHIAFTDFTTKDVPLYYRWADKPHVKEKWFRSGYEPKEAILDKIGGKTGSVPFIIRVDNKPIGYIQSYEVRDDYVWEALKGQPKGTFGFDIFIAEEDYLGKGYGSRIVSAFSDKLHAEHHAVKMIVDPFSEDKRAIRCYKKAGFTVLCEAEDDVGTPICIMEKHF